MFVQFQFHLQFFSSLPDVFSVNCYQLHPLHVLCGVFLSIHSHHFISIPSQWTVTYGWHLVCVQYIVHCWCWKIPIMQRWQNSSVLLNRWRDGGVSFPVLARSLLYLRSVVDISDVESRDWVGVPSQCMCCLCVWTVRLVKISRQRMRRMVLLNCWSVKASCSQRLWICAEFSMVWWMYETNAYLIHRDVVLTKTALSAKW